MEKQVTTTYRFVKGTQHFVQPKQWASMRKAEELERTLGRKIIHFERGDFAGPEFGTPKHVEEAGIRAIREGLTKYAPGPGLPELREAVAAEMTSRGRPTDPEETIINAGAKFGLTTTILTLVEDEDEVIFPNPGYPPDEVWIKFAGGMPVYAPLTVPDFQFDLDELRKTITPQTKLLIINTPQRPCGKLVENLEGIAEVCLEHDLLVISDEIFSHMVYEGFEHKTISAIPEMRDRTIVIDTFSKTYMMTGWRLGWVVAPRQIIEMLSIFLQNIITNVAAFVQRAGFAALTGPQDCNREMVRLLQAKRDRLVNGLDAAPGIRCDLPAGAFYAFPDITGTGMDSQRFTDYLMEEYGVAVVAGTAFGDRGEGYVRLTYAMPDEQIDEGLERIREAVENL